MCSFSGFKKTKSEKQQQQKTTTLKGVVDSLIIGSKAMTMPATRVEPERATDSWLSREYRVNPSSRGKCHSYTQ